MATENPFKGCTSYEDGDKFYGRENEIKEIEYLIKNEFLTLLFSRSGIGKSSIIKAGIFPALKKDYEFFPIYIHLNEVAIKETSARNLCDFVIKRSIESIKEYFSTKENFKIISPENSKQDSLFEFTHNLQIIGIEKSSTESEAPIEYLIKPVFFFDQFEEIFTQQFDKNELQYLLKEIRSLVENELPDYLKEDIISSKDQRFVRLRSALKSKQKSFRIVFSFREEYLPHFESLRNEIPSIRFTNSRYRLEPFTVDTAKTIIVKTAPAISDEIALEVAESIATQIDEFDDIKVDPFLLSLICQIIYADLLKQNHNSSEKRKLEIKSLVENAIESYVAKVYKSIDDETKKFIEQKLITSDGKKNSVNFNDVANNSRLKNNLEKLAENPYLRLLNIGQFLDSRHVSILHDRLLPPLIKRKQERKSRENYEAFLATQTEWKAKKKKQQRYFLAFLIAGFFLFASFYYVIDNDKQKASKIQHEASIQRDSNLYLIRKAETLNQLALNEHNLALIEKNNALIADSQAKENQKKYLNQKKLTDSISEVKASLQNLAALLQKSYDSNLVSSNLNSHNINYYLGRQSSLLPLIFDRLLKLKASKNEDMYQRLLQSIDSTVQLTYKYSTYVRPREMLEEIKAFWKNNKGNEVVDSLLTGFLNNNLYYQQKIELDEANKSSNDFIEKSSFAIDSNNKNQIQNFAFAFNKNIYSGTFNNDEILNLKKMSNSIVPGDLAFKEKYKTTIGNYANIIFSPDSTHAITYSQSNNSSPDSIILWNLNDRADKHILKTGIKIKNEIRSIIFSSQSKRILILSQKGLSLFDPELRYTEVLLNQSYRVGAANFFTNDGNKIISIGRFPQVIKNSYVIPIYVYDISRLDSAYLSSQAPKNIGFISYGIAYPNLVHSISLSSDESKILLQTAKGIIVLNRLNKDGDFTSDPEKGELTLPYKKFYSNDTLGDVTFTDANSIVAIGDSANVYVLKIYPEFKNADEAFTTIKKAPLSLIDLLRLNPGSDTVYNKILSSNNRRYLSEAAQYYYENYGQTECIQCGLLKSKELYKKLLNINKNINPNNQDAAKLITTIKLLSGMDYSFQNKEAFYSEIVDIANNYKNSQSQHDLSIDYGNLAFYSFFVKKFNNALEYAIKGLELDSTNDYIYTNLALGYLFTNKFDKAEEIYNGFKDKARTDNQIPFKESFLKDFNDLETNGIITREDSVIYEEVEKIRNVILN